MLKRLRTDRQFETACRLHATVYVREKAESSSDLIGGLEGFNPLFVTVSGEWLLRDEFDFMVLK